MSETNQELTCEIKRLNDENQQLIAHNKRYEQRLIETQQENKMLVQQPIQLPSDRVSFHGSGVENYI